MSEQSRASGQGPAGGQAVILIVEDEPLIRMATADMLTELGYAVREAADANEALSVLRGGGRIDVLLTDLKLPGMSGGELISASRALRPGLRAVVVTGYAAPGGDTGMAFPENVRVLAKPFQLAQLKDALRDRA